MSQLDLFSEPVAPQVPDAAPKSDQVANSPTPEPASATAIWGDEFGSQAALFNLPKPEAKPEPQIIYVHFEGVAELNSFARLIGQSISTQTRVVAWPTPFLSSAFADFAEVAPPPVQDADNLFGQGEWWEGIWQGMPEFVQPEQRPFHSVELVLPLEELPAFARLVGQTITPQTRFIWHPEAEIVSRVDKLYVQTGRRNDPRHPIYVISKGRWERRYTARSLERMGVDYRIVIEPQEREEYAKVIDPAKIILLPFSNLGQGSIPARNFVWDHAVAQGAERHWIIDDNIMGFYRLNRNMKLPCEDGSIFRAAEDWVDRWENVGLAGFQYWMFAPRKAKLAPLDLNTRIYSCILIRNDLPYRWRGKYNEDTDLSLRALKDGWVTALFYAFIADKQATMVAKGGNTDELYKGDGRLKMAESLVEQHPDVTKITWKWDRWQHQVDYTRFKRQNKLRPRAGIELPVGVDNYGMELRYIGAPESRRTA